MRRFADNDFVDTEPAILLIKIAGLVVFSAMQYLQNTYRLRRATCGGRRV
jgi:hypothetical protein